MILGIFYSTRHQKRSCWLKHSKYLNEIETTNNKDNGNNQYVPVPKSIFHTTEKVKQFSNIMQQYEMGWKKTSIDQTLIYYLISISSTTSKLYKMLYIYIYIYIYIYKNNYTDYNFIKTCYHSKNCTDYRMFLEMSQADYYVSNHFVFAILFCKQSNYRSASCSTIYEYLKSSADFAEWVNHIHIINPIQQSWNWDGSCLFLSDIYFPGIHGLMATIVGNGHGTLSSNSRLGCLHFTLC